MRMALESIGIKKGEKQLVKLLRTNKIRGTRISSFPQLAEKFKLNYTVKRNATIQDLKRYQKEGYVQGSGDHLPFADESFDIVVSHASIPLHAAFDRKDVSRFIEEIRRVLKKGGECRFGPVGVGGAFFPVGDPEERASGVSNASWEEDTVDERVRKTSLKTTALLRELVPDLKNSTDDLLAQTNNFYSFVK